MKTRSAHLLGWIIALGFAGLYMVEMRRTQKLNKIVDVATKAAIVQLPELDKKINQVIQRENSLKNSLDSLSENKNTQNQSYPVGFVFNPSNPRGGR